METRCNPIREARRELRSGGYRRCKHAAPRDLTLKTRPSHSIKSVNGGMFFCGHSSSAPGKRLARKRGFE